MTSTAWDQYQRQRTSAPNGPSSAVSASSGGPSAAPPSEQGPRHTLEEEMLKLSGFSRPLSRDELGAALKKVLDVSHPGEFEKIGKQGGKLTDYRVQRLFQSEVWIHFHSRMLRDSFLADVRSPSAAFPEWVDPKATPIPDGSMRSDRLWWNMIDPKPIFRRNQAAQKIAKVLHEYVTERSQTGSQLPFAHEGIKTCRKSGGVYVDRTLVAAVSLDAALRPSFHPVDDELVKLGLDVSEVRQRVVALWGRL